MPRHPPMSEAEVRAEFDRIKGSGLKLLSAYPTKTEYYRFRRLFTDAGLCGHQSREDRLVRARKYCVNWRLKNREKLFSIRKEKSESQKQIREEAKAQKRQQLEECRKALLTTKAPTKKKRPASLTALSASDSTKTKRSRKSASAKKDAAGSAGPASTSSASTSMCAKPLTSS